MASMSNYLENKLIDFLFRSASFTPPSTLYVALCTATPTDSSTGSTITEVSGGNYSRQSIGTGTSNWYTTQGDTSSTSSGTTGNTSNAVKLSWSSVTWSATVNSIAICDASTAGNVLWYGALTSSRVVSSGESISINIGELTITIDN